MKFKKINYIELQMSGDEFDDLIGVLEAVSQNRTDYPIRIEDLQKDAYNIHQKITNSMNKKEVGE